MLEDGCLVVFTAVYQLKQLPWQSVTMHHSTVYAALWNGVSVGRRAVRSAVFSALTQATVVSPLTYCPVDNTLFKVIVNALNWQLNMVSLPKIISKCCELAKLYPINRRGPPCWDTLCNAYPAEYQSQHSENYRYRKTVKEALMLHSFIGQSALYCLQERYVTRKFDKSSIGSTIHSNVGEWKNYDSDHYDIAKYYFFHLS